MKPIVQLTPIMNTIRDVLKDCLIAYNEVQSKLSTSQKEVGDKDNDMFNPWRYGVEICFPNIILTIHPTYHHDTVDVNVAFRGNDITNSDASQFASMLAKQFDVILPPKLHVKEGMFGDKKPESIEMLLKCTGNYRLLVMFMLMEKFPKFCDENIL